MLLVNPLHTDTIILLFTKSTEHMGVYLLYNVINTCTVCMVENDLKLFSVSVFITKVLNMKSLHYWKHVIIPEDIIYSLVVICVYHFIQCISIHPSMFFSSYPESGYSSSRGLQTSLSLATLSSSPLVILQCSQASVFSVHIWIWRCSHFHVIIYISATYTV